MTSNKNLAVTLYSDLVLLVKYLSQSKTKEITLIAESLSKYLIENKEEITNPDRFQSLNFNSELYAYYEKIYKLVSGKVPKVISFNAYKTYLGNLNSSEDFVSSLYRYAFVILFSFSCMVAYLKTSDLVFLRLPKTVNIFKLTTFEISRMSVVLLKVTNETKDIVLSKLNI